MKPNKTLINILLFVLLAGWPLFTTAQDPEADETVRGTFLKSRQKTGGTVKKQKPPASPRKPTTSSAQSMNHQPAESTEATPAAQIDQPKAAPEEPVALGFTLYQRGPGSEPVRVSPAKVFHSGDALRLIIESNIDGYLYIFH